MAQVARPPKQTKAKKFMVIIRPGFKKICGDDACKAGMFNHILYNIAKQKQAGSDYWFSTGDAIWEETDRAWGKSKTLKEIKDLETTGIVARMRNPHNSWDQTRYYTFREEQAKALHELCVKNEICLASMRLPSAVTHLLNLTNAFCENKKCICCNQQIDMLNIANPFVENEIFPGDEAASQAGSESPSEDSYQDSTEDSFLSAHESDPVAEGQSPSEEKKSDDPAPTGTPEQYSYSQDIHTTTDEEDENHSHPKFVGGYMASLIEETDATLVALEKQLCVVCDGTWLQENAPASIDPPQPPSQVSVVVTQVAPPIAELATTLFPVTEQKPVNKHTFGNLREGLGERDVRQVSPAEQKRIDEAEKRAELKRVEVRKQDLWAMAERIVEMKVPRTTYAKQSITSMAETDMPLEDIEIIMQRFASAGRFDLTPIANYLPTYAARKKNKIPQETGNITPFPSRYQSPQQEIRIAKSRDASHMGDHLNAADYDEEPVRATR